MSGIRAKNYSDKEVVPKMVYVGDPLFIERNGKWYDKDGNEIEVITCSLEDLLIKLDIK